VVIVHAVEGGGGGVPTVVLPPTKVVTLDAGKVVVKRPLDESIGPCCSKFKASDVTHGVTEDGKFPAYAAPYDTS
jgi:hypothetical protein